jgi:hypothetical protein
MSTVDGVLGEPGDEGLGSDWAHGETMSLNPASAFAQRRRAFLDAVAGDLAAMEEDTRARLEQMIGGNRTSSLTGRAIAKGFGHNVRILWRLVGPTTPRDPQSWGHSGNHRA